jgi:hypothetical protein
MPEVFDMPEGAEDDSSVKLSTKDLKSMGLAAGGKLGGYFPLFDRAQLIISVLEFLRGGRSR